MKWLVCLFLSLVIVTHIQAQDRQPPEKDFAARPLWIAMLDDTSANYFVVEQAFNTYFQHHEMPESEHEVIGEQRGKEKVPSRRKQRRIWAENKMRMDIRRYYLWKEQMLPYVQDNGRILTPAERLAIWKSQQKG